MQTAFKQSDWPFQEPGETCLSCKAIWDEVKKPPKIVRAVYDWDGSIMRTENVGIPIACCSYCDGDLIFRLPKE